MAVRSTDAETMRSLTAGDRRAHRRSRSEQIRLTFNGADQVPLNWSEGGALIEDRHPDLQVGAIITGVLTIGSHSLRYRFSAEVVRRDSDASQIALEFLDPSPSLPPSLRHALASANS